MLEFMRLRQPQGEQDCKLLIFIPSATGGTEEPRFPKILGKFRTTAGSMWKRFYRTSERIKLYASLSNLALPEQHVTYTIMRCANLATVIPVFLVQTEIGGSRLS
jgi:hypothetical protein